MSSYNDKYVNKNKSSNKNKSNNKNKSSNKNNSKSKINYPGVGLVFVACGLIPLLVSLFQTSNGLSAYDWFANNDTEYDFFLKIKMIGIIVLAGVMLGYMVTYIYNKSYVCLPYFKDNRFILSCAAVYIVMAFVSAVMAENVKGAFLGNYAQYEPFLVLAGYMIFLLFTYLYINSKETINVFLNIFMWAVTVISFLGVLQFIMCDFFKSYLGKSLITIFSDIDAERISLSFEPGRVYMTLYNPNYVGSYVALVLPVIIAGLFVMEEIWQKYVMACNAVMLIICLVGSASTTGMTAILLTFVLAVVICVPFIMKHLKKMVMIFGIAVICFLLVGIINRDRINDAINKYRLTDDDRILTALCIIGDEVEVTYKGEKLKVDCNILDNSYIILDVYDTDNNKVPFVWNENTGRIECKEDFYRDIWFSPEIEDTNVVGFNVISGSLYTFIYNNENNEYYYRNSYGKMTQDIVNSESIGFEGHEQFASNRGFIWSRTIPLLFDNILYGCGPDNFIYEFPNNDYVAMANNTYSAQVVTKPHNMYLQIGVQTGVISLVAIIVLYVAYFVQSIKLLFGCKALTKTYIISISILLGSFGYMVCGLANDSTVCVAPVFWVLIGIGLSCNRILRSEMTCTKMSK